jgi:3-hydroxyisobutyrate dehydrogenase
LVANGAIWRDTPADVAAHSDIVFTMVGYPSDVEEVYFGDNGIFKADVTGRLLVDMTTSTPTLAEKIAEAAFEAGTLSLDAPVSGGDIGAKNGTLTIMVGGNTVAYDRALPIFKVIGKTYNLAGGPGKGQHTKMANQIGIAGTMTAMTEMLVYAKDKGLDLPLTLDILGGGGANTWSLQNYGPRILKGDYTPGFFIKHYIKDLKIALDEAEKSHLDLPGTKLAKELYDKLASQGRENDGTQALIKLWWDDDIIGL